MAFGIPESTVEEIKARVDLADLIASYGVAVKRAGASYKACCPFHHEKTPSFNIQPDKGYYHCFGCGKSGDAIKFVQEQEGLTFVEAVKKLAERVGVTIEEKEDPNAGMRKRLYALHAELAAFYRRCLLKMKEAAPAREYLKTRQLPDDIAEGFQIGYAPLSADTMLTWAEKYGFKPEELNAAGVLLPPKYENGRWYNRFGGRLMFTICDRSGRAVAFSGRILTNDKKVAKYVNSPETVIFKKSNILFALHKAAPNIVKAKRREAIVCEGQIDVIRCHASGFPVAVASQGTAFTEEHVKILKKCADSVVLVFDADGAGQKASIRTGREFLAAEVPVRVATLPEGEDPDSMLRDKGATAFQNCLDDAESIIAFQIRVMRAAEPNPDSIDAVAKISREALTTIASCPSAILRASLMNEAAALLHLPVGALESDFEKVKSAPQPVKRHESSGTGNPPSSGLRRASGNGEVSFAKATEDERGTGSREPDLDGFEGVEVDDSPFVDGDDPAPELEAAELPPVVVAPSELELTFCEFLMTNERNGELRETAALLPPEVLRHEFTRKFVAAWAGEFTTDDDLIAELRGQLDLTERKWFDRIVSNDAKSEMSELGPIAHMQAFLRRVWSEAVRHRLGGLSAESSPENDRRRLELTMLVRVFERGRWDDVAKKMNPSTLGTDPV